MKKASPQEPEPSPFDHPVWKTVFEKFMNEMVSLRINLSDVAAKPIVKRGAPPVARPSKQDLGPLVKRAQIVITHNGGAANRPPPKRQHIDTFSYAYGLLWGAACALDCSLNDVIEKFGDVDAKAESRTRRRARPSVVAPRTTTRILTGSTDVRPGD